MAISGGINIGFNVPRGWKTLFIPLFLAIFGIFFVVFSNLANNQTRGYIETTATITRMEKYTVPPSGTDPARESYRVYVDYTVNGVDYKDRDLGGYASGMKVGDPVNIKYNPANPEQFVWNDKVFMQNGVLIGSILLGAAGVLTCVIVGVNVYKMKKNKELGINQANASGNSSVTFTNTMDEKAYVADSLKKAKEELENKYNDESK